MLVAISWCTEHLVLYKVVRFVMSNFINLSLELLLFVFGKLFAFVVVPDFLCFRFLDMILVLLMTLLLLARMQLSPLLIQLFKGQIR